MRLCIMRNVFRRTFSLFLSGLLLLSGISVCVADSVCKKDPGSTCKCVTESGRQIDLTPLVRPDDYPLFNDQKTSTDDKALYSYKPCVPMSEPVGNATSPCYKVAVCQVSSGQLYNIGDTDSAEFFGVPGSNGFHLRYTHLDRTTSVQLECSTGDKALLTVLGENKTNPMHYDMVLSTKYACVPGVSPAKGLSVGSILLILLFVFLLVYIVGGVLFLRLVKGARGVEQIPNYQFWADFPGLVKDGTMFVCRGCKGESDRTYDQI